MRRCVGLWEWGLAGGTPTLCCWGFLSGPCSGLQGKDRTPSLEDSGQALCSLSCMVVLRSIPHSLSKS